MRQGAREAGRQGGSEGRMQGDQARGQGHVPTGRLLAGHLLLAEVSRAVCRGRDRAVSRP